MDKILFYLVAIFPIGLSGQITYHENIAPIINNHCISCHQKGEIGPMSLANYQEVSSYASMIHFVTSEGIMPPFKANSDKVTYQNERSISKEEIDLISEWISSGLIEGLDSNNHDNSPPASKHLEYDYTICMQESFEHYGIYYDEYQAFVLPVDILEDKIVTDIIFDPGNPKIVRSANISIVPKGAATKEDAWDPRYGFYLYAPYSFRAVFPNWFSWMPQTPSLLLQKDESVYLPKNSDLILHIHYGPFGEIQSDSSCVHFNFSDKSHHSTLQNVPLVSPGISQDSFVLECKNTTRLSSRFNIPCDSYLNSLTPLSHLLCRNWEVFVKFPDNSTQLLLTIDDWDFHWKEKYVFDKPIYLPEGSIIYSSAFFDNTVENPFNPSNPPRDMKLGGHMFDENFTCHFEFLTPSSSPAIFLKEFSVAPPKVDEIQLNVIENNIYSLILHDLSNQSKSPLLSRSFTIGTHRIRSSIIPSLTGRYALILMNDVGVCDSWYFVVP